MYDLYTTQEKMEVFKTTQFKMDDREEVEQENWQKWPI